MAVDVMPLYTNGRLLIDEVEVFGAVDFDVDEPAHEVEAHGPYTFRAEVFVHGERCLFDALRASAKGSSFDVVERYRLSSFAPNVSPVLDVYPGRSVVTGPTYFELVTVSRLVGASETRSMNDGSAEVELLLEQGAPQGSRAPIRSGYTPGGLPVDSRAGSGAPQARPDHGGNRVIKPDSGPTGDRSPVS